MAEFRRRFYESMSRLDGAHERKIVALGAAALLAFLSFGPTVLNAVAHTITTYASTPDAPPTHTVIMIAEAPTPGIASTEHDVDSASGAPAAVSAPLPPPAPPLTFLFPQAGASSAGPVSIAVRLENAKAIAMLFEVTNPAGERLMSLPASLSLSGEWSALFTAEPGEYVIAARASLEDGRVVAFKEHRAFRLIASEPGPIQADPSEPVVELTAPGSGHFESIAPLGARMKNAEPNALVFFVTSPDGTETLVLGSEASGSGYWTATFEGPNGDYRVRARATVGEREFFSQESTFTLKAR